jgi:hypothetical protein
MLDLDNGLLWSFTHSHHSTQKAPREKRTLDCEAYLDFLDDIDAFHSLTAKKESNLYEDEFVL